MDLSTRQLINRIYKDICGFEIPKTDEQHVRSSTGSPIYGEITTGALSKLLKDLRLNKNDVFYDLGSGVGKVVMQTALASAVGKAIGVELSETRYENSLLALTRAKTFVPRISSRCRFINDDILRVDLSQATVIYTCSTAFSQKFMRQMLSHIAGFKQKFKLVSLQDLPDNRYFSLHHKLRLDMSWQRSTAVYIYHRV